MRTNEEQAIERFKAEGWTPIRGGWPDYLLVRSREEKLWGKPGDRKPGETWGQTGRTPSSNSQKPVNIPSVPRFSRFSQILPAVHLSFAIQADALVVI